MAQPPSIKATGFQSAADDLIRLVDAGRISRGEVEARLRAEDLRYLDKQLAATTWVPIDCYRRLVEILVEVEANGPAELYLHGRGVRAAQRLHKAGLYRQFEASAETWGNRVGKIATTMAAVLYNFTRWSFEAGSGRGMFQIVVDEAREFPEVARFTTQGFIEYASRTVSGGNEIVRSERPNPDKIVYRGERVK
ncbi:MAG TPA: hypothetical protein VEN47_10210 [Myxococcota bacterium]|nr:hypothetical protein [Myxococcota bacterium]